MCDNDAFKDVENYACRINDVGPLSVSNQSGGQTVLSPNRATNKALQQELSSMKQQLQRLRDEPDKATLDDDSVTFLLAEFSELGQFWRHTDDRIENGINYFLTASAVVSSVLAFASQQITDTRLFAAFVALVTVALFVGGYILMRRIVGTSLNKAEYTLALNLIRRHFADKNPSIEKYLVLPKTKKPTEDRKLVLEDFRVRIPGDVLWAIRLWVSALLGFIVGTITWLVESHLLLIVLIVMSATVMAACYLILTWATNRQIESFKQKLMRQE